RDDDCEFAILQFGVKCRVVETASQAEVQLVIPLHTLEVQRLPVDPHDPTLSRGDRQIETGRGDLDSRGVNPGHEYDEPKRVIERLTLVVWPAKRIQRGWARHTRHTTVRAGREVDGVHGRKMDGRIP